ncbi:MAG: site-2 protease family protein, partial [Pyrinomonadaceae bacterium]|nr:site-2 protease family protein [Pyrinomonadaceae bacterium]
MQLYLWFTISYFYRSIFYCFLHFSMQDFDSIATEIFYERDAMRPTLRTWLKHIALLLLTAFTATVAGVLYPFGLVDTLPTDPEPQTRTEIFYFILSLPDRYVHLISGTIHDLFTNEIYLKHGLSFSLSLLFILICHEMGHYVACRIYKVDATLPYFIPTPPMIGPAGTFGAFIKILSPMPSRKAVFDIGVAGPIAGFVALIPVAVIGFLTWQVAPAPAQPSESGALIFADPLFFKFLAQIFAIDLNVSMSPNPFYFAAWVGLLVTALNLIPSGQLDGGHAIYSIFGTRIHQWMGRIAFVFITILSITGWFLYSSPSGFLFAVILAVMMRVRHPEPIDDAPLD